MNARSGKIRVAIVGCGAIGKLLAQAISSRPLAGSYRLVGLCDIVGGRARALAQHLSPAVRRGCRLAEDYRDLIPHADLVIEAASLAVARPLAEQGLRSGKDVLVLSAGGLLGSHERLARLARSRKAHLYIPSGALGGLDVVRAMGFDGLRKVTLVTRKPPRGLPGAREKRETCLFSGSAREAVRRYPQNLNVAALLQMGVGRKVSVRVKLFVSPSLKRNTHELLLEGKAGTVRLKVANTPSIENPKTSQLAVLSVIATLNRISGYVSVGS